MALKIFNKCMLEAAHCMVTKTPFGKKRTASSWFDFDFKAKCSRTASKISEIV